jgi:feruloyl esterase
MTMPFMTTAKSSSRGKVLSTGMAGLIALAAAIAGLGLTTHAAAGATSVIQPVRQCADLVGDLAIPGAATHVTAATLVPAGAEPEHCDVRGYIEPAVHFQLKLPTATYTGRYLQYGCMGLCGGIVSPPFPACAEPAGGDFAVAATDDGHVGQGDNPFTQILDGTWAASNQAARDDYFFRAPHVLSVAAKRIIAAYYGSPPRRSYFNGCSTGGREGLLLAQRYPHDFGGIIAGDPANYMGPLLGVYFTWLAKTNTGPDGAPILTIAKLPALHDAALAACDRLDGLADGQIDDPPGCKFDPVAIQCQAGTDQPDCLTPAQVASARRLYNGPADPHGRRLYPGWEPRGSELAWDGSVIPDPLFGSIAPLPDNYLRYVGYPIGTPHSSLADFEFTVHELNRLTPEGVKGNALSLDLSAFRRAGGKLIIWHGWADQSIPPAGTLDYYQRLWQHNGGLRETQNWARLFMVPTVYHCAFGGGYRLTEFHPFRALVAWVEDGKAPSRIIARQRDSQGNIIRSRPVFPYPQRAKYDGTGSIDDASNFLPAQPPAPPHDIIPWAGTDLYAKPGPVAP